MPPKRTTKKRQYKRRYKRKNKIYKRPSLIHTFSRKYSGAIETISVSTADVYKGVGMSFKLSNVPNATDFTNLFDLYKINWVKLTLTFAGGVNWVQDTYYSNFPPQLLYCYDIDDVNPPASSITGWNEMQEVQASKMITVGHKGKSIYTFKIYPKTLTEIYNNGITTAYKSEKAGWVDCANDGVNYFGFKYILRVMKQVASGNTLTMSWLQDVELCVSGKNPR